MCVVLLGVAWLVLSLLCVAESCVRSWRRRLLLLLPTQAGTGFKSGWGAANKVSYKQITMNSETIANGLDMAGGVIGGAVGNGMEAVGNGISAYNDYQSGNTAGALVEGAESIYHGAEAFVEGSAGVWIAP